MSIPEPLHWQRYALLQPEYDVVVAASQQPITPEIIDGLVTLFAAGPAIIPFLRPTLLQQRNKKQPDLTGVITLLDEYRWVYPPRQPFEQLTPEQQAAERKYYLALQQRNSKEDRHVLRYLAARVDSTN